MKKVIIVDDEAPARSLVKEYLDEYRNFVLVEECNNGVDAVNSINKFKPDLVFLDIQMPGLTGFEVLQHLDYLPQIVFSTAYDQYALEAFDVHALDYLLKPYTKERFAKAIERASLQENDGNLSQLKELINTLGQEQNYLTILLVPVFNKLVSIPISTIVRISADGDYANIITRNGKYLSNHGISKIETKLDPRQFIRVHRSSIINSLQVKEVYKYSSGYDIIMSNEDVVKVSRTYLHQIKKLTV